MLRHQAATVTLAAAVAIALTSATLRAGDPAPGQIAADADANLITLNFPDPVPLKVFVEYVARRLNINILYDEQIENRQVTINAHTAVPASSLTGLLESALKMKGLALIDAEQPGWKRVAAVANLVEITPGIGQGTDRVGASVATRVFKLAHIDPARADLLIKPLLSAPGGNSFLIPEQHLLVVTDYASNLKRVAALIDLADQPAETIATEFVPARHQQAAKLAELATNLIRLKSQAQSQQQGAAAVKPAAAGAEVQITHDPRTNQVILIGPPARVKDAVAIVKSLDVSLGLTTKMYHFALVSPERIDKLVKQLVGPVDEDRLYHAAIDDDGGYLVVSATPQVHEKIESLKRDLDVAAPESQSPIRFYKLMNTAAADVVTTLSALEGGEGPVADTQRDVDASSEVNPVGFQYDRNRSPRNDSVLSRVSQIPSLRDRDRNPEQMSHRSHETSGERSAGTLWVHSDRALITADVNTNSIIIVARPEVQTMYEKLIRQLDQRRPQVLIEATIVTLDTTDDFTLGVELGTKTTVNGRETLVFSSFGLTDVNPSAGPVSLIPGVGFNGAILDNDVANIVIQALKTNTRAKVVSAPRILVNDNATGSLESISEEPYVSVNASDTVSTTSFGGFVEAGTSIEVTPHISEGDHLTLAYRVALNSFTGNGTDGIPPPRQTNSIESDVTVPDGHTVVVGGLNRTDSSNRIEGLPLLGEIPVLKHLFRNEIDENSESTLFVFIRPVILRDDQFKDLKFVSKKPLDQAELPGDFPTSEPLSVE
jgi:general secretion pathway protein D